MATETTFEPHIAYELIEDSEHQVVVIKFLSHEITNPTRAARARRTASIADPARHTNTL